MNVYTLYYMKLGSFHKLDEAEFQESCKFYRLFKNSNGQWQNGRGDIFIWKNKENDKEE